MHHKNPFKNFLKFGFCLHVVEGRAKSQEDFAKVAPMKNESIKLVKPSVIFKESYLEGLLEFQEEKLPWVMDIDRHKLRENFEEFVTDELNKRTL